MTNLLTAKEAAKILKVNLSTVSRYKRSGMLPYRRYMGKDRFPREAVEQLERERNQGYTASDLKGEVLTLRHEVARLKRLMDFLLMKLGLRSEKLYMSDADLINIYKMCNDVPRQVSYKYGKEWLEVVLYLTEVEFERMIALTGDPFPWRRIFEYTEALLHKIHNKKNFKTNVELQTLAQHLAMAQQEVRNSAILILSTKSAKMPATERFDILMSKRRNEEADPEDILKRMKLPGKATEADQEKLTHLLEGLKASQGRPPEDAPGS